MKKNLLLLFSIFLLAGSAASAIPLLEKSNLFKEGQNGFACYRIPGIIVTAKGTVLAYCEARKNSSADEGEIEIHIRRSTDGGKTWSSAQKIAHLGERLSLPKSRTSKKHKLPNSDLDTQTVHNPVAIAGRDGTIHFLYGIDYQKVFYMKSGDDGLTWSKPVELSPLFESYRSQIDWQRVATGPGHAIQLRSGRLVVPFWMSTPSQQAKTFKGADATIYSDDDGKTWQAGDIALPWGNEPDLAELPDGRVIMTGRNSDPRDRRIVSYSRDGATGWSEVAFVEELLEPRCMAGMVAYSGTSEAKKPLLLFSNPNTTLHDNSNRVNVTIKASDDGGKTWPVSKLLQSGPSAYSDLAVLPDGTILCLYESGTPEGDARHHRPWAYAQLTLAHFNLDWLTTSSETAGKERIAIPLWPNGAPGALGTASNDIPTLTPYLPETVRPTGAAMVICPGGGYSKLMAREGNDYALWLNQHGITCFVLKYRLGSSGYRHPAMLNDAARAMRWVRAHAAEYKISVNRVGIIGSSAGGHLASTMVTHFDAGDTNSADVVEQQSSRPDLGILCYPVITFGEFAHQGSRKALLGTNPPPELVENLSNELQVKTNTPPCFLWSTWEDKVVPIENTLLFATALRKNHVPFALHVYAKGGHGMGLNDKPPFANPHPWANECLLWLKEQGFIE